MAHFFIRERALEDLIEAYVASRGKARYLSISHAIRAIRTFNRTDISDCEMADLVATAATERNISVDFDLVSGARELTRVPVAASHVGV